MGEFICRMFLRMYSEFLSIEFYLSSDVCRNFLWVHSFFGMFQCILIQISEELRNKIKLHSNVLGAKAPSNVH